MSKRRPVDNDFDSETIVQNYTISKIDGMSEIRGKIIIDLLNKKGLLRNGEIGGVLLEVGCGYGGDARVLAEHFDHVIGIDASVLQISLAKEGNNPKNLEFRVESAENLSSIADDSIDVIAAFFTIQLLDDLHAFIRQCRRVLKKRGIATFYMEIVSSIAPAGNDNVPTIVNKLSEAHRKTLQIAKAMPHHQRHVLGRYQDLFTSLEWTNKSIAEHKVDIVTDLQSLHQNYLSVPFYAMLGDSTENPLVELFDEVRRLWCMEDVEKNRIKVKATFDTVVIILESDKH